MIVAKNTLENTFN